MRAALQDKAFPAQAFILFEQGGPGLNMGIGPVTEARWQVGQPIDRRSSAVEQGPGIIQIAVTQIGQYQGDYYRKGQ